LNEKNFVVVDLYAKNFVVVDFDRNLLCGFDVFGWVENERTKVWAFEASIVFF